MPEKGDNKVVPLRASRPCPLCGKKAAGEFHPFCSKHCSDVDLNRWLKGNYAIPGAEVAEDESPAKPGGNADDEA